MTQPHARAAEPVALHERAFDHLRYIRETMERADAFTALPGRGGIAMGVTALLAAAVAAAQPTTERWLAVWLVEAAVAVAIGSWTLAAKARRSGVSVLDRAGRRFGLGWLPAVVAGAALTAALYRAGAAETLPASWLLLYGASLAAGGAVSMRLVTVMGWCLMGIGMLALVSPAAWGDAWLGLGFGGLHVVFGVAIARRHDG